MNGRNGRLIQMHLTNRLSGAPFRVLLNILFHSVLSNFANDYLWNAMQANAYVICEVLWFAYSLVCGTIVDIVQSSGACMSFFLWVVFTKSFSALKQFRSIPSISLCTLFVLYSICGLFFSIPSCVLYIDNSVGTAGSLYVNMQFGLIICMQGYTYCIPFIQENSTRSLLI